MVDLRDFGFRGLPGFDDLDFGLLGGQRKLRGRKV